LGKPEGTREQFYSFELKSRSSEARFQRAAVLRARVPEQEEGSRELHMSTEKQKFQTGHCPGRNTNQPIFYFHLEIHAL